MVMVDRQFSDARLAALYDRLYPLSRAMLDFYLPLVLAAPVVLDAGCGTGALLKQARQAGHTGRLCGLDPAAGMLAQARTRTDIEWIHGDVASIDRAREFDLIVMTGHAFQVLVEDEELKRALGALRAAAGSAGRFVFETRNPAARAWESWTREHSAAVTDGQGYTVRVTLQVDSPFDGRTVSFTQTYSCEAWDQPQVSRSVLRFLDAGELSRLLAEAGFVIEEQFGDFDRQPLTHRSPEIITIARAGDTLRAAPR
jgi:SAM-dependent methyltransferase